MQESLLLKLRVFSRKITIESYYLGSFFVGDRIGLCLISVFFPFYSAIIRTLTPSVLGPIFTVGFGYDYTIFIDIRKGQKVNGQSLLF